MSGTVEPGGRVSPPSQGGVSREKPEQKTSTEGNIVEQGVASVASIERPQKVRSLPSATPTPTGIDVAQSVAAAKTPIERERKEIINELFSVLISHYQGHNPVALIQDLQKGVLAYNDKNHSFVVREHIIYVSKRKPNTPLIWAIIPLGKNIGKGSYGTIYPFQWSDASLEEGVLKYSRKKLKEIGPDGQKIPLTPEERAIALETRTAKGKRAKEEIEKEIRTVKLLLSEAKKAAKKSGLDIQDYLIGLHLDLYGIVTHGHRIGYITRKFDCDGFTFAFGLSSRPPAEACFKFMIEAGQGLSTLHRWGFFHRDIKLENILIKFTDNPLEGTTSYPAPEVKLTDFGNAIRPKDLFSIEDPYPTFRKVCGTMTIEYCPYRYAVEIDDALNGMKNWEFGSKEYRAHVTFIKARLKEIDECAFALVLYQLWTGKEPDFKSFNNGSYFDLDPLEPGKRRDLVLRNKIGVMQQEIHAASFDVSKDHYGDENKIARSIVTKIQEGLSGGIRAVKLKTSG